MKPIKIIWGKKPAPRHNTEVPEGKTVQERVIRENTELAERMKRMLPRLPYYGVGINVFAVLLQFYCLVFREPNWFGMLMMPMNMFMAWWMWPGRKRGLRFPDFGLMRELDPPESRTHENESS